MQAVCPRLGLIDDPATSYAFPHAHNACHAVEPACPVRPEHQAALCLSGKYKTCSLYHFHIRLNSSRSVLSEEVLDRALVLRPPAARPALPFLALLGLFLLSALTIPLLTRRLPLFSPQQAPQPASVRMIPDPTLPSPSLVFSPQSSSPPPSPVSDLPSSSPAPSSTPSSSTPLSTVHRPPTTQPFTVLSSPSPVSGLPSSSSCPPPLAWVTYTIRPGDTLFQLALASGTTVEQLRTANCLPAGAILSIGHRLYLPRRPAVPPAPTNTRPPPTEPPTSTQPPAEPPPISEATATSPPAPTDTAPLPTATSVPPTPRQTPTGAPTLEG